MNIEAIKEKITKRHGSDEKQLEVIFSEDNKIIVEAPAGFGKTNTMVSKIAYMIASNQIPTPKKLLALTFSVNAAYKIKKDVLKEIPDLLNNANFKINDKLYVSNYHGFCRNILRKNGYILSDTLLSIDGFQSIDDSRIENNVGYGLEPTEAKILADFNQFVKNSDADEIKLKCEEYNSIVISKLLPQNIIPYNAILTIAIKLLKDNPNILDFYKKYFVAILVDEFQDTNFLSWTLLHQFIDSNEYLKLIFLGDSLQRIYGFIGAVPNLITRVTDLYNMSVIKLNQNYRFKDNQQMLILDSNIRKNAESPRNPNIQDTANIYFSLHEHQDAEASYIIEKTNKILEDFGNVKIAVLAKTRGKNIEYIINKFSQNNIPYFYALFTDDDIHYLKFNRDCLTQFIKLIKDDYTVNKSKLNKLVKTIKEIYEDEDNVVFESLIKLLEIFREKIFIDFAFLADEEKINLIKDTFESNGLKQYIEFIDANVMFSTIHGAKGLEWDYVIIPDMEAYSFPNYYGLCGSCSHQSKENCNLLVTDDIKIKFLEELSVFYVAVTRARKQVHFTASEKQIDSYGNIKHRNISCFMKLKGINTIQETH
jgi:DNA helicase-2/ATP-dependent DNA helicase PcrA